MLEKCPNISMHEITGQICGKRIEDEKNKKVLRGQEQEEEEEETRNFSSNASGFKL